LSRPARTIVVELRARRAGGAYAADDFVAELDHNAAAEEHYMRELGQRRDRILALGCSSVEVFPFISP